MIVSVRISRRHPSAVNVDHWPIGHVPADDLSVDDPRRRSDENSSSRHKQAKVPEYAAAGEQGDRGDYQGYLQEDFAEIEAVGFATGKFAFLFQFAGLGVEFLLIIFIAVR